MDKLNISTVFYIIEAKCISCSQSRAINMRGTTAQTQAFKAWKKTEANYRGTHLVSQIQQLFLTPFCFFLSRIKNINERAGNGHIWRRQKQNEGQGGAREVKNEEKRLQRMSQLESRFWPLLQRSEHLLRDAN